MNTIMDGEPHILSEDCGYITKKIDDRKPYFEIEIIKDQLLRKYIEYILENRPEECYEILLNYYKFTENYDKYSIIYRPPWIVSCLSQYAMLTLKFKRVENDNLKEGPG